MSQNVFGMFAKLRKEIDDNRRTARRLRGLALEILKEVQERGPSI